MRWLEALALIPAAALTAHLAYQYLLWYADPDYEPVASYNWMPPTAGVLLAIYWWLRTT